MNDLCTLTELANYTAAAAPARAVAELACSWCGVPAGTPCHWKARPSCFHVHALRLHRLLIVTLQHQFQAVAA